MTEGEKTNNPKSPGEGAEKKTDFTPSWLFNSEDELTGLKLDPNTKFAKVVNLLHKTPEDLLDPERLKEAGSRVFDAALEEEVPEEVYGFVVGRISELVIKSKSSEVTREKKPSTLVKGELPLHIGAVFSGGRNELQVEHESIPVLDIKKENDRIQYILENIHAFNVLLRQPTAWKAAIDIWLSDAQIAAQSKGLERGSFEEFKVKIMSAMAITASARLMESSGGDLGSYLTMITGGGEKPATSKQEEWSEFLLHADPDKLNKVLDMPLVATFFSVLMEDAGLVNDEKSRWRKEPDSENPSKEIWKPSSLRMIKGKTIEDIASGRLMKYLREDGGGFNKYIEEVLLPTVNKDVVENNKFSEDSVWAAARLACDVFLVDFFPRWEYLISEGGTKKVDLYPSKNWGGDPLFSIIKPSSLPRLKGVYRDEPKLLDWIDASFKPLDVFVGERSKHLLVPSMATNIKKLARYNDALNTFLGDSMASGVPNLDPKTLPETIGKITSLFDQLYGQIKEKDKNGNDIPVGKHIVGAMLMRVFYTKVAAAVSESDRATFLQIIGSDDEKRPFYPVLATLLGPDLSGKSGLIKSLVAAREGIVIEGNMFGAEKQYKDAMTLLFTNDQTGSTSSSIAYHMRIALRILSAFSNFAGKS
jgi:hypothetical protein